MNLPPQTAPVPLSSSRSASRSGGCPGEVCGLRAPRAPEAQSYAANPKLPYVRVGSRPGAR
jgi:hypothetical protein